MLKRRFRNQKGVSAIEFALVLPVLLLFLGGTIDFGIIFFINHMAGNAAREGARLAAASAPLDTDAIKREATRFLPGGGLFQLGADSPTVNTDRLVSDCEIAVNVSGQVPYFFLSIFTFDPGSSFTINRTVTIHYDRCDEL